MAKYARIRDGFLTDVYTVPSQAFPDMATLDKCLPGGGFIVVPDDKVHGAKDNGDGTYTNPSDPPQTVKDKTPVEFEAWAIARVGSVAAWQNLLEKCVTNGETDNNAKEARYFPRWSGLSANKSKAEFQARCTPLTLTTPVIISAAALTAALAAW